MGFENLGDLTIGPCLDAAFRWHETPSWPVNILSANLRRLVLLSRIAYSDLEILFRLPCLNELELSLISDWDQEDYGYSAHLNLQPRTSSVTRLKIAACVDEPYMLRILEQPKRLQSLALIVEATEHSPNIPPRPHILEDVIACFKRTLTNLELQIDNTALQTWTPPTEQTQMQQSIPMDVEPFARLEEFEKLSHLTISSFYLFGLTGPGYTRHGVSLRLPSSLESLAIEFGPHDPFFQYDRCYLCTRAFGIGRFWERWDRRNFQWILELGETAYMSLPRLRKVTLHDRDASYFVTPAWSYGGWWRLFVGGSDPTQIEIMRQSIEAAYATSQISIQLACKNDCGSCRRRSNHPPSQDDYANDYGDYYDYSGWFDDILHGNPWDPLLASDPTVYTDTHPASVVERKESVMQNLTEAAEADRYYRHYELRREGITPSPSNSDISIESLDTWDFYT